jgi:hypothetical protein
VAAADDPAGAPGICRERRVELCGGGTGRRYHPAKFVAGIVLHFVSYRRHLFS